METWEIVFICATIGSVVVLETAKVFYILWRGDADARRPFLEGSRMTTDDKPTVKPNAGHNHCLAEKGIPATR
jgi:hypothetical protein